jgi:hypothetical protein
MRNRQACAAVGRQYPGQLADGLRHVVDVVQAHIGDNEIESIVRERQFRSVAEKDERRVRLIRSEPHHRGRGIDAYYLVLARFEQPAQTSFTAGQI